MMKWWVNLLPLCFIKWQARKHCQWLYIANDIYVAPFDDVLIRQCVGKHVLGQTCPVCKRVI